MKKLYLFSLVSFLIIACGQKKTDSNPEAEQTESEGVDFVWLKISDMDSVKFKGYSKRFFNNGKDSVVFGHYSTNLYRSTEDSEKQNFRKQSIEFLNALSLKTELPDTMYIQAVGEKSGTFIKKSSDFNILAGHNGEEWKVKFGDNWYGTKDFE